MSDLLGIATDHLIWLGGVVPLKYWWVECFVSCQPKVHVNYDFQPRNGDELEIRRGEVITVTDNTDPNWWEGQVERENVVYKGHFPVSYVTQIWVGSSALSWTLIVVKSITGLK